MRGTTDLGLSFTILVAVAIGITTLAVLLRCYVRIALQRRFSADDYLVLFSQANFCAFMFCVLHEVKYGHGKHLADILMHDPSDLRLVLKYWWISQPFYIFATCTIKVSVAVFFCSLCPPRNLRLVAIGVACASIATGLGTLLFQMLQCAPVSHFWDRFNPTTQGTCLDPHKTFAVLQTVNAFDIATDFMLALLPYIMVWNLTMSIGKKFGVSILLGLGALSAIAAIVRAFYFKNMLLNSSDFTYSAWPITITSAAEPAIGITVVCLAQLRPLMRQIFPKGWFTIDETRRPTSLLLADLVVVRTLVLRRFRLIRNSSLGLLVQDRCIGINSLEESAKQIELKDVPRRIGPWSLKGTAIVPAFRLIKSWSA